MKKWQVLVAAVVLLGCGFLSGVAQAANRSRVFTLTPFAGGYEFEGNQRLDDGPVYGLALGYNFNERWGAEAVVTYTDTESAVEDMEVYGYRLDLLYHFRPDKDLVPYLAAGLGGMSLDPESVDGSDEDGLVNYGLGLKYFLNENVALRADVRHIFDINLNDSDREHDLYHNLSYTAGVTFQFDGGEAGPQSWDSDGDGVSNSYDRCPDTPEGIRVDYQGCPLDNDRDGVLYYLDKCPGTPAGAKVDRDGCPVDSDKDGVPDYLDKCPGTPAGTDVDAEGCPKEVKIDSDGDGVEDRLDQCPDTPQGVPVNEYGCPYDSDSDGVYDFEDQCPGTPRGTVVDEQGCPKPKEMVPEAKPSLTLDVQFETGAATIAPEFRDDLKKAADFIDAYPESRVVIEGHTDSVGPAAFNQRLSQRRADSVREYLIANFGIDSSRLNAQGFGETQPIADNATVEGRRQNRRVVITVVPE